MRLYLPCVEARLRSITALWFCRKKGHLHTIPCNEQEWDKELAYNCHFTQNINKSYIIQSTHIGPTTEPNEKKTTQLLDPRSSQLGSTTDQPEKTQNNDQDLHQAPTRAWLRHLHWYHRYLQLFGSICESRGLSNLTPTRSRLFKLIGKDGVVRWSCSKH